MKPKYFNPHAGFYPGDGYRFVARRHGVDIFICASEKRTTHGRGPRLVWGTGYNSWDGYSDYDYLVIAVETGGSLPGYFGRLLRTGNRDEAKVLELFRYVIALEQLHS